MKYDFLLFLTFFIYYTLTCSKWLKSTSSAIFLTSAYEYGFPKPPGYPIITFILRLFYTIFPPNVVPKIINGGSSAMAAASGVLTYKTAAIVTDSKPVGLLSGVLKACLPYAQSYANSSDEFPDRWLK